MSRCAASYLLERYEEEEWPNGDWLPCGTDATHLGWLNISDSAIVFVELCDAHAQLWAEKIGLIDE